MPRIVLCHMCVILSLTFALLLPLASASEPKQDALTAKEVLERVAKTYASCKTYRDSGVVRILFIVAVGNFTEEKSFSTGFVRPDRFRFEYKEKKRGNREYRYIVWRKGKEVQTWWDVTPGIKKPKSLGLALAGATGVSSGSAHTIPALLMPDEVGGRRLTDIAQLKRVENAMLEKDECFRIQGQFAGNPMTLWVDKKTFLVRRIDSETKFDNFSTQETTTYKPVIDADVSEKMLQFDPPKPN